MSTNVLCISLKLTGYTNAKKVRHGDWRDDRPPHGRGGRASKDGLAACRRVNAMASLYKWQAASTKLLITEVTDLTK
jgi:hypothetical protein